MLNPLGNRNAKVQYKFFRTRQRPKFPRLPSQKTGRYAAKNYANADPFIAAIVSARLATATELKKEIDLEEAMDLWEIATTDKYNEAVAVANANERR